MAAGVGVGSLELLGFASCPTSPPGLVSLCATPKGSDPTSHPPASTEVPSGSWFGGPGDAKHLVLQTPGVHSVPPAPCCVPHWPLLHPENSLAHLRHPHQ